MAVWVGRDSNSAKLLARMGFQFRRLRHTYLGIPHHKIKNRAESD